MKTLIIFAAGAALAGSAFAQGTISAPSVPRHALPPLNAEQSEGGLQRGVRLGNPLEMFNPFAPKEYGEGREFVTPRDEEGPGARDRARQSPVGLRLISFSF